MRTGFCPHSTRLRALNGRPIEVDDGVVTQVRRIDLLRLTISSLGEIGRELSADFISPQQTIVCTVCGEKLPKNAAQTGSPSHLDADFVKPRRNRSFSGGAAAADCLQNGTRGPDRSAGCRPAAPGIGFRGSNAWWAIPRAAATAAARCAYTHRRLDAPAPLHGARAAPPPCGPSPIGSCAASTTPHRARPLRRPAGGPRPRAPRK
jgi:hypothetical protein